MRKRLAGIVTSAGVVGGLTGAVGWGVFIWGLDWGRYSARAWVLWGFTIFIGAVIIFGAVASLFGWIASRLDPG